MFSSNFFSRCFFSPLNSSFRFQIVLHRICRLMWRDQPQGKSMPLSFWREMETGVFPFVERSNRTSRIAFRALGLNHFRRFTGSMWRSSVFNTLILFYWGTISGFTDEMLWHAGKTRWKTFKRPWKCQWPFLSRYLFVSCFGRHYCGDPK